MNLKMKQNTLNEGKGNKLDSELWLAREGKATTIPHKPHSVDKCVHDACYLTFKLCIIVER